MNKKNIMLLCASVVLLFGLGANGMAADKYLYGYDESTAKTSDPNPITLVTPLIMDVEVNGDKVSHQKTFENKLDEVDIERAKDGRTPSRVLAWQRDVLAEASAKYNADVIVAPNFVVRTSPDYKTVTISVTGFPAKYVNFRSAKETDIRTWQYFHTIEPPYFGKDKQ